VGTGDRIFQKVWVKDGHFQAPKHVVASYVENTLYSNNKCSSVRPVHNLYISYFIEQNGDDKPHVYDPSSFANTVCIYKHSQSQPSHF